jgi:hypothetical protein
MTCLNQVRTLGNQLGLCFRSTKRLALMQPRLLGLYVILGMPVDGNKLTRPRRQREKEEKIEQRLLRDLWPSRGCPRLLCNEALYQEVIEQIFRSCVRFNFPSRDSHSIWEKNP